MKVSVFKIGISIFTASIVHAYTYAQRSTEGKRQEVAPTAEKANNESKTIKQNAKSKYYTGSFRYYEFLPMGQSGNDNND